MTRSLWVLASLCAVVVCACTFKREDHPAFCGDEKPCGSNEECVDGFCVVISKSSNKNDASSSNAGNGGRGGNGGNRDASTAMDATSGSDASSGRDAQMPPEECVNGTAPEECYGGDSDTRDVGECRSGQRACVNGIFTPCLGQVLPEAEICNGRDDDCDGTEDEIEEASCDTQMKGICAAGMLVCRDVIAVCQPQNPPIDEVCNALDDDCDGKTDEVAASECFPTGASGCTKNEDGSFTCLGLCKVGHATCTDEGADSCDGAIVGQTEACTTGGGAPVDENCDGQVDEGCTCSGTESRACYAGPPNTEGKGACRAGTQTCSNNSWGPCNQQVLPQPETCANGNADDDCNEIVDDVPGLGESCIADGEQGICRDGTKKCVQNTGLPTCAPGKSDTELCDDIDQDCDGNPTNGFDLGSDENCGKCGNKCDRDATCCRGECVKVEEYRNDANNCGACGNRCGYGKYCCWNDCIDVPSGSEPTLLGGQLPPKGICACSGDCGEKMCCGQQCLDLNSDHDNCGSCGHACASASRGSLGEECCNGRCQTIGIIGCGRSL